MSDGTKYHRDSMTCAHKRYPLGTMLKVTNLNNGKSVVVKVTDRGPHTRGRIIDLSYAAARQINMIASGVVMVKVEVYRERNGIPYRDEGKDGAEFDFEFSKYIYDYTPEWQLKATENGVISQRQRENILSDEEKISQLKEEIQISTKPSANKKMEERQQRIPHKASQRHGR